MSSPISRSACFRITHVPQSHAVPEATLSNTIYLCFLHLCFSKLQEFEELSAKLREAIEGLNLAASVEAAAGVFQMADADADLKRTLVALGGAEAVARDPVKLKQLTGALAATKASGFMYGMALVRLRYAHITVVYVV